MDIASLEQRAREAMGPVAHDYFAGGADDEVTLRENDTAWQALRLRPHVLRDVSAVDCSTTVLGQRVETPVVVAPAAYQRLANDEGEAAMARGAAAAGALMCLSTLATMTLEDVAAAAPDAPRWFQLYVRKDRGFARELTSRAAAAGYLALVVTVDVPVLGRRRRDEQNNFTRPLGFTMGHVRMPRTAQGSELSAYVASEFDASLTFDDIEWLCGLGDLPVLVKGVLRGDDAVRAVDSGAAGVIVSNHGARQLDTAVTTAAALPEVADALQGRVEILVDGGVRRGTDVIKALALGARAVLVARPVVWGLAVGGAAGVEAVLTELTREVTRALMLCGAARLDDVDADLLA